MTIRHSYYDKIWLDIADVVESDKIAFTKRCMSIISALDLSISSPSEKNREVYECAIKLINLPDVIALERFEEIDHRSKREALSRETRIKLAHRIELRRFYAVHLFVQMCGRLSSSTDTLSHFTQVILDKFNKDALEMGYSKQDARENATTQTIFHFSLALFANNGRPTFVPSSGLTESLIYTEFRDVPSEMVQLPHPALFIEAPLKSGLFIPNVESGLHELYGAFVVAHNELNESDEFNENKRLQIVLVGHPKEWGKETHNQLTANNHLFNDALFHFSVILKPHSTVGDCIKGTVDGLDAWDGVLNDDRRSVNSMGDWMGEGFENCVRFVLNTLLYITLPDTEIDSVFSDSDIPDLMTKLSKTPKGSKKRSTINEQIKKKSHHKYMLLGSSVKIDRSSRTENGEAQAKGHNHKLSVAFIRRGHWRNQPFGTGRKQTRIKWIKPTMVNPDGPMKITTYMIE